MNKQLKELDNKIKALMAEKNTMEAAELNKKNIRLIGKYYKARNNYSCPQIPEDYWWVYLRIDRVDGDSGGLMGVFRFQTDKYRRIWIEPDYSILKVDRYEEISKDEFDTAYADVLKVLEELK